MSTKRVNLQASFKKYEGALEYANILLGNSADTETVEGASADGSAKTVNTDETGGNSETVVMNDDSIIPDSVSADSVSAESVSAEAESSENVSKSPNVGGKKKKRNRK